MAKSCAVSAGPQLATPASSEDAFCFPSALHAEESPWGHGACFQWKGAAARPAQSRPLHCVLTIQALARLTTFKPLPTHAMLKEHKTPQGVPISCNAWFQQVEQGTIEGGLALLAPVSWQEAELSDEGMKGPLEMIVSLLLERLDSDHDGSVTRAPRRCCICTRSLPRWLSSSRSAAPSRSVR